MKDPTRDEERELLQRTKKLWDSGLIYEALEVLEDLWRLIPKEDRFSRNCYQGLIRLAIAYNHYKNRRLDRALRVLNTVKTQLSCCGETFRSIDVKYILNYVERHITYIELGKEIEDFPELKLNIDT